MSTLITREWTQLLTLTIPLKPLIDLDLAKVIMIIKALYSKEGALVLEILSWKIQGV